MECTDEKTLPKQERKRSQIESAPHKSEQAKVIKIADKISNVKDLGESPPKDWGIDRQREYLDWTEEVVSGLRGINAALDEGYDLTLNSARSKIERNSVH
jgi:(p)ppGpp synthase/HD superfamily hydrolase